jgi:hypothetical protein
VPQGKVHSRCRSALGPGADSPASAVPDDVTNCSAVEGAALHGRIRGHRPALSVADRRKASGIDPVVHHPARRRLDRSTLQAPVPSKSVCPSRRTFPSGVSVRQACTSLSVACGSGPMTSGSWQGPLRLPFSYRKPLKQRPSSVIAGTALPRAGRARAARHSGSGIVGVSLMIALDFAHLGRITRRCGGPCSPKKVRPHHVARRAGAS